MKKAIVPKRIDQLLPCYAARDAIGTHTTSIQRLLEAKGFASGVYAEMCGGGLPIECRPADEFFSKSSRDSIVIHHFSTGSWLPGRLLNNHAFKVTNYHNITPPIFFSSTGEEAAFESSRRGRSQIPMVRLSTDVSWTESKYNSQELANYGYPEAKIFPILRDYGALANHPNDDELSRALKKGKKKHFICRENGCE